MSVENILAKPKLNLTLKSHHNVAHLHAPIKEPTKYQLSSPYDSADKILKFNVTTARSKFKSRSHHNDGLLQPTNNVPTKYQLSTPYGFGDRVQTRLARSNQGHTIMLHTYAPQ